MKLRLLIMAFAISQFSINCQEAYKVKTRVIEGAIFIDDKVEIDSNMNILVEMAIAKYFKTDDGIEPRAVLGKRFSKKMPLYLFAKDNDFTEFKTNKECIEFKGKDDNYRFQLNGYPKSKKGIHTILEDAYLEYRFQKDLEKAKALQAVALNPNIDEKKEVQLPSKL